MVVEPDNFNKVVFFFLVLFQFFFDDLFETIDDELFYERGRGSLCHNELFVGLGILMKLFHVEEGERDM